MKFFFLTSLSALAAGASFSASGSDRPNIILILADDMGYPALSCYGNKLVQTPNIDRIAAQGIKFTSGYVAPQSTPTRACLLTGQYGGRNKMWHVLPYYGFPYARIKEPEFLEELPRESFTLAEALKKAGYATACLGKWHLSKKENDGNYTYLYPDRAHFYGFDYVNPVKDPPEYQAYGDKGVDFLTDEAIAFIERNRNNPFFVYLSHHTIHGPVLAPEEIKEKYILAGYKETGLNSAVYLAALDHFDKSVGRLSESIFRLGLERNTIIIFISDNGGVDYMFDNTPLRYGKGSPYEGGIRIPFIIKWPGKTDNGSIMDIPVHIVDIYPTLVQAAGLKELPSQVLDGKSLIPLLNGSAKVARKFGRRPLFFYQPLYDIQWGATPCASVIENGYKLIHFFGDYVDLDQGGKYIPEGRTELYEISRDIGEVKEISKVYPKLTVKMLDELFDWMDSQGAEIPGLNPDFNIERWDERTNLKK